jgi:Mg-chelatase subunit ChlI
VLFLDELPEFKRSTLEVMRQPLEDGRVTISRAAGTLTFPSEFMLVAAMNPCPCGYFGDLKRECRCSPVQVQRYRQRISGPLLDRIDLHIEVPSVEYRDIASERAEERSDAIRARVGQARERQQARFRSDKKTTCNARMSSRAIKQHCRLTSDSQELIRVATKERSGPNNPAMLWIFVVSIASSSAIGGMMVAIRFESIDLPEPGGPIMRMLWPPATATSTARLTWPWPLTSAKSTS